MTIDVGPLKRNPQFRYLFFGQLISTLGSNISYVAAPFLIYQMTHSTAMVGLVGVISLIPMVIFGFWGGSAADVWNRKKIVLICEGILALLCVVFALLIHAELVDPYVIFILCAVMSGLASFHRPALESLTPRLVKKSDLPQISSLNGFRSTFAHILGPAIGGLLLAKGGASLAFWMDALSYLFSIGCLLGIQNPLRDEAPQHRPGLRAIREGFSYAVSKPVLLGTYLIDMIAMVFCYPVALFPAFAEVSGGTTRLGPLYSAISVGALFATVLSAWTYRVRRHGTMVVFGALGWCVCVIGFAACISSNYWLALSLLAGAGYFDMISATFRFTIWNETIPDSHRGRLAGIEMISYMSGPLLGNTLLGFMAARIGPPVALIFGALISIVALLIATVFLLPFWRYTASERESRSA
jgi:MFS family permease